MQIYTYIISVRVMIQTTNKRTRKNFILSFIEHFPVMSAINHRIACDNEWLL